MSLPRNLSSTAESTGKGSYSRPTISAPFIAEPKLTAETGHQQLEYKKPENYSSMRSLVPNQGFVARRQPSRDRRGNKSEPPTPTPDSPPERKSSHKLPALVRDHAVVFSAKENSGYENYTEDDIDTHVEVSISSIGRHRNISNSSLGSSSIGRSSSISSSSYSSISAQKMTNSNHGKEDGLHRRSKAEVAASNSFSSDNSLRENLEEMKTAEKTVEHLHK